MTTTAFRARETWIGFAVGLIGTVALPFAVAKLIDFVNPPHEGGARRIKAVADVRAIEEALDLFERENGRVPTSEEGLEALVPTELARVPIDPWGHEYAYVPGRTGQRVVSYGSDGSPGGVGAAADIDREKWSSGRYAEQENSQLLADGVAMALFLGSILALPVGAIAVRRKSLLRAGILAGAATLIAVVAWSLGVTVLLAGGVRAWMLLGIGLLFSTGAVATLLGVRFAGAAVCSAMALLAAGAWTVSGMIAR